MVGILFVPGANVVVVDIINYLILNIYSRNCERSEQIDLDEMNLRSVN